MNGLLKRVWGSSEPPSEQEITDIKNKYTKDTIFYTEPFLYNFTIFTIFYIEEVAKEIASE
jgi:hypothetical protein